MDDIERWSETVEILHDALEKNGAHEAALQAVLRCLSAANRDQLAADIVALSQLYPGILNNETVSILGIILKILALELSFSEYLLRTIESNVLAVEDQRIAAAWMDCIWRHPKQNS